MNIYHTFSLSYDCLSGIEASLSEGASSLFVWTFGVVFMLMIRSKDVRKSVKVMGGVAALDLNQVGI